jgi:site-specific recombinase XerD
MNIHFYLDKPNQTRSLIFISVSFQGERVRMSTKQNVLTKHWDFKREKVKLSGQNSTEINALLNNLRNGVEKKYLQQKVLGNAQDQETVKTIILELLDYKQVEEKETFFDHYEKFIEEKDQDVNIGKRTITYYRTVVKHLKEYSEVNRREISFETMNEEFYHSFTNYLSNTKELSYNTVVGIIKRLKVFLNYSIRVGYTDNDNFRFTFKSTERQAQTISLTLSEVEKLENYKTTEEEYINVRDLFLILIYTGLRYSDLSNLKKENIFFDSKRIEITTIKTRDHVIIPIHRKLEVLLKNFVDGKYNLVKNLKFNQILKSVCMDAGIDDTVQKITYYGHRRVEDSISKYDLITSHVGRRTYITLSLMKGAIPEQVMQISGHADRSSFQRYVRLVSCHLYYDAI